MIKETGFITKLNPNEIFVFGSNLAGKHENGAAKIAIDKFGAIYGQGTGLQGQTYALPTVKDKINNVRLFMSIPEINKHIIDLYNTIVNNSNLHFLITEVGCNLANHTAEDIAPLFKQFINLTNISLPKNFIKIIT